MSFTWEPACRRSALAWSLRPPLRQWTTIGSGGGRELLNRSVEGVGQVGLAELGRRENVEEQRSFGDERARVTTCQS